MSRHATRWNKRDANEMAILQALARIGVQWIPTPPLDGWCVIANTFIPVEIKNPEGRNRLQKGQEEFIAECMDLGRPVMVWRSADEAIEQVNSWRQRA